MSAPTNHPAMQGYELDNLLQHAATPEGRKFLEMHRGLIRECRDHVQAHIDTLRETVAQADELLQRFAVILDKGGEA
ncbi:hypothetical protein [Pseudoxanthomonas sp.]|uniref:hypothetical protein n=1 Tax=Pseudoxanthomonas sp. TaxID=1871049 RepID=UPI0025DC2360|nr:hypothetical protein [Pseudoxanthomonas sp.]